MHDRPVTEGDPVADLRRAPSIDVHHAGVLHVALGADDDRLHVPPHRGVEPDRGVPPHAHLAHERSPRGDVRSEEHTSELQSPCNLVCRLLLEKKKTDRMELTSRSINTKTSPTRHNSSTYA